MTEYKTLKQHIDSLPDGLVQSASGDLDILVTAPVVERDQDVAIGGIFVARTGRSTDGHRYIDLAVARGAGAVVGEQPAEHYDYLPVPYVQVLTAHNVVGLLSASYHDFPSRKIKVIGVTGTDGKTSASYLLYSILKQHTSGKVGLISTIAADFGDQSEATGLHVTTPSAPQVQAYLARMVEAGLDCAILEMTSHGLVQGRLSGVEIDVAVLTNLTHEHLDYHGSWDAYREAKATMFRMLQPSYRKTDQPKVSIINADDGSYDYFAAIPADQIVSYGIENAATYQASNVQFTPQGTQFEIGADAYTLQLVGKFNVLNALAAQAAAKAVGASVEAIQAGLAQVEAISGRMERIDEGQGFMAIVDFAHTPNALKHALETGRQMLAPDKKLIAVFGSAGLRDVQKRRLMPETSAQLADMTILTAEDPRTVPLDDILEVMAQACIKAGGVEGETFIRVRDRGEALFRACEMANAGDLVMACGKGHEQSMCFGTIEYDWDDREALRAALRGTPLKTLPTATEGNA